MGVGYAGRIWRFKPGPKVEDFDDKWIAEPNTGCWLWLGATDKGGYGRVWGSDRRSVLAHRRSWELRRGAIARGVLCLHRCDTPACVNPEHLFLGSYRDNTRDMVAKGRQDFRGRPRKVVVTDAG